MSSLFLGLVLAFLVAPAPATDLPSIPTTTVRVHDLAALTGQEAAQLQKQRALFRVVLHTSTDLADGLVSYECQGPAEDDVCRTLWLPADLDIADATIVEAHLRIIPCRESDNVAA